jgi:hypothetical protein
MSERRILVHHASLQQLIAMQGSGLWIVIPTNPAGHTDPDKAPCPSCGGNRLPSTPIVPPQSLYSRAPTAHLQTPWNTLEPLTASYWLHRTNAMELSHSMVSILRPPIR